MVIIASIPGCILFSIIIGLIIKCVLRSFRVRSGGGHLSYISRCRNHFVREAGMMQMSVINESNTEGTEMPERLDICIFFYQISFISIINYDTTHVETW